MTADDSGARGGQAARGLDEEPLGSVYVQLELSGRWAISILTQGWSTEEKAALMAGDQEAREALVDAAEEKTLHFPDDVELAHSTVWMGQQREETHHA